MVNILSLQPEELKELVLSSVKEALKEHQVFPSPILKPPQPLSRKEVAKMLGISLVTLSKFQRNGSIKFRKLGKRVYFIESEVLESLKTIKMSNFNFKSI